MGERTSCDTCHADLGDHTPSRDPYESYEVVIVDEDGATLCGSCWEAKHGIEPFELQYTPHTLVWPAEVELDEVEDFETEELIEEIEEMAQLSLWQEAV